MISYVFKSFIRMSLRLRFSEFNVGTRTKLQAIGDGQKSVQSVVQIHAITILFLHKRGGYPTAVACQFVCDVKHLTIDKSTRTKRHYFLSINKDRSCLIFGVWEIYLTD